MRLIDSCITPLKSQGPSRTCNESKEEEEAPCGEVRQTQALGRERESLLNLWRRTVKLRRPERARNEGSTEPKRLDDTRCKTYTRRINSQRVRHSRGSTLSRRAQGSKLLRRNLKRFRGGLVFQAHRLVDHSTLGWRVIKKKKNRVRHLRESEAQQGQRTQQAGARRWRDVPSRRVLL